MVVRDMRGREIRVGDIVAYPGRKGSSLWMSLGEVVGFDYRNDMWGGEETLMVRPMNDGEGSQAVRQVGSFYRVVVVEPAVKDFEDKSHLFDRFPG